YYAGTFVPADEIPTARRVLRWFCRSQDEQPIREMDLWRCRVCFAQHQPGPDFAVNDRPRATIRRRQWFRFLTLSHMGSCLNRQSTSAAADIFDNLPAARRGH